MLPGFLDINEILRIAPKRGLCSVTYRHTEIHVEIHKENKVSSRHQDSQSIPRIAAAVTGRAPSSSASVPKGFCVIPASTSPGTKTSTRPSFL